MVWGWGGVMDVKPGVQCSPSLGVATGGTWWHTSADTLYHLPLCCLWALLKAQFRSRDGSEGKCSASMNT